MRGLHRNVLMLLTMLPALQSKNPDARCQNMMQNYSGCKYLQYVTFHFTVCIAFQRMFFVYRSKVKLEKKRIKKERRINFSAASFGILFFTLHRKCRECRYKHFISAWTYKSSIGKFNIHCPEQVTLHIDSVGDGFII